MQTMPCFREIPIPYFIPTPPSTNRTRLLLLYPLLSSGFITANVCSPSHIPDCAKIANRCKMSISLHVLDAIECGNSQTTPPSPTPIYISQLSLIYLFSANRIETNRINTPNKESTQRTACPLIFANVVHCTSLNGPLMSICDAKSHSVDKQQPRLRFAHPFAAIRLYGIMQISNQVRQSEGSSLLYRSLKTQLSITRLPLCICLFAMQKLCVKYPFNAVNRSFECNPMHIYASCPVLDVPPRVGCTALKGSSGVRFASQLIVEWSLPFIALRLAMIDVRTNEMPGKLVSMTRG